MDIFSCRDYGVGVVGGRKRRQVDGGAERHVRLGDVRGRAVIEYLHRGKIGYRGVVIT